MHILRRLYGQYHAIARRVAIWVTWGGRVRIVGGKRAAPAGPLVVAGAHTGGPIDIYLAASAVPRRLQIAVGSHYARIPMLSWWGYRTGLHLLHESPFGYDERNLEVLKRAAGEVRDGAALIIFPEGFGTNVGGGAARIAAQASAPTLPLVLHGHWPRRGRARATVLLRRPLPPPGEDARSRRRHRDTLRRVFQSAGGLRTTDDENAILDLLRAHPAVWAQPLRVLRLVRRVQRLDSDRKRRLARRARGVLRMCRRLRCAPDDIFRPPGIGDVLRYAVLFPATVAGLALAGPALLTLRLLTRKTRPPKRQRLARLTTGLRTAFPYGLGLAAAGAAALGPLGLLAPVVAAGGLCTVPLLKESRGRILAMSRVRRALPRLLQAIEREAWPLEELRKTRPVPETAGRLAPRSTLPGSVS